MECRPIDDAQQELPLPFPELSGAVDAAGSSNWAMIPAVNAATAAMRNEEMQAYATARALAAMARLFSPPGASTVAIASPRAATRPGFSA